MKDIYKGNHPEVANCLNNLGNVFCFLENYGEAI